MQLTNARLIYFVSCMCAVTSHVLLCPVARFMVGACTTKLHGTAHD